MPLDPYLPEASPHGPIDVLSRIQLAARYPEHSFIWWLEAQRSQRIPDRAALHRRYAEIFESAWPERTNRLLSEVGTVMSIDSTTVVTAAVGTVGYMATAPTCHSRRLNTKSSSGCADSLATFRPLQRLRCSMWLPRRNSLHCPARDTGSRRAGRGVDQIRPPFRRNRASMDRPVQSLDFRNCRT